MENKRSIKSALEACTKEVDSWPAWKRMLVRGEDFITARNEEHLRAMKNKCANEDEE